MKINRMSINGVFHDVVERDIIVKKDKIFVGGNLIAESLNGDVKIIFEGDLANLDCTNCVVNGTIRGDVDSSNLECKDIVGDVDCTNLKCNDIGGDVDCTTLQCHNIVGNVDAKLVNYIK